MRIVRKIILLFLLVLTFSLSSCMDSVEYLFDEDIVVLYTNDAHCATNENLGYAKVSALKKYYEGIGKQVVLVDIGDAIQGSFFGSLSKGESIIKLMNKVGYDLATLGNHEFDFGVDQLLNLSNLADFEYLSCNFYNLETNKSVFNGYKIINFNGVKVGFVGISSPESITSSIPKYFKNEEGEYIYGFCQTEDGELFYQTVQNTIDKCRKDGASYIVALGHLGSGSNYSPYSSNDVINHTYGIDVLLDANSHQVCECEYCVNKKGENVIISQTGTKLANIGVLTISKFGKISTKLVSELSCVDEEINDYIDYLSGDNAEKLKKVIATTNYDLLVTNPVSNKRMVRNHETNLGDLWTDAYRIISGADIGMVNGGAIRSDILVGDITYEQIIAVNPFGNKLVVIEVTGQQILDALEFSAYLYPSEFGGFMQVSGMSYEINSTIPSSVEVDANKFFVKVNGEYRVSNVLVNGEPLQLDKSYTVAGGSYQLLLNGDGYTQFNGCKVISDNVDDENAAIANYISNYLGGIIPGEYANYNGQGRIVIK